MKRCSVIAAAIAAACSKLPSTAPTPAQPSERSAAPSDEPMRAAGNIFGEWQVVASNSPKLDAVRPQGRQLTAPRRVAMLVGVHGIEAASQCVPYLFEHRREGTRLDVVGKLWPGPVCARGLSPHETVFSGLVQNSTRIEQVASGGLRLSGTTGTVILQRPEGGFLANPFGNTPAPGPELLWGHFRVVEAGGVQPPPEQPIDVAVARWWIEARSGCVPFRWAMDTFLALREDWSDPVCERARSKAEQAMERVMPAVRRFEWIAPYRVRLIGPAGSVTLVRAGAGASAG